MSFYHTKWLDRRRYRYDEVKTKVDTTEKLSFENEKVDNELDSVIIDAKIHSKGLTTRQVINRKIANRLIDSAPLPFDDD